jgi:alkaline phosphatase D
LNIPPIERRQLLQLLQLAAAAVGTLWLPRSAWSQPRLHSDPFGMGVASGSPAADSVVLWARLQLPRGQTQPVTVRWEHGYYSTYCHMRADNPDLVVFFERLHLRVPQRQPSRARATRGVGYVPGRLSPPLRHRVYPGPFCRARGQGCDRAGLR